MCEIPDIVITCGDIVYQHLFVTQLPEFKEQITLSH